MGTSKRPKPARLAEKLLHVRVAFCSSQNEMVRHLGLEEALTRAEISAYERGVREPALPTLLRYARLAGICLDLLVDDALDLPKRIPAKPKH